MIKTLEDFKVYNLAMELGEDVWNLVGAWGIFEKDTIGKQFIRATDSIAANLSEGLGRYHFKEAKNFGYYSRGSLFETKTWLTKAGDRKLINAADFANLSTKIEVIGKMLNSYINSIGITSGASEPIYEYGNTSDGFHEHESPNAQPLMPNA